MKKSVVNSGFLPLKEEKPKQMVGSLAWFLVQSSVSGEAELAALIGHVFGEALGPLGQRESVGLLAVDQGCDDARGRPRQVGDACHTRAIDVEGTILLPIPSGIVIGTIYNADHLFRRLGLPRAGGAAHDHAHHPP